MGLRDAIFGEEMSEEHSQFQSGFHVAGYGDPLLEERLLGSLDAAYDGVKRRRVRVVGYRRAIFQAACCVD